MIKDENMELAIQEAKKAAQRDEIPVGAIIKAVSYTHLTLPTNREV